MRKMIKGERYICSIYPSNLYWIADAKMIESFLIEPNKGLLKYGPPIPIEDERR